MQSSSEYLAGFYEAMRQWIKDPSYNPFGFNEMSGLCNNLLHYCAWMELIRQESRMIQIEMEHQFLDAGYNAAYPFNNGSADAYYNEVDGHYENKLRLLWIQEHTEHGN